MCVQFMPMPDGRILLEWVENGHVCNGLFDLTTSAMTLSFAAPGNSTTSTYRPLDNNSKCIRDFINVLHIPRPFSSFG